VAYQLLRWQNEWFEVANTLHSEERKQLFHHHNTCGTDEYPQHRHVQKRAR
jgi:hypothetical protein